MRQLANALKRILLGAYRITRQLLDKIFDTPMGRPARKVLLTVAGVIVTLMGVVLIVLPGPAFLLIPIGLAILAIEYPSARKLLRKFQLLLTQWAKKADNYFARRKTSARR